jgi:type IV pilus assembly protein PilM
MAHTTLGLDVGKKYIKYVELASLGKGRFQLVSLGMSPSPAKDITSEAGIDHEILASTIRKLLKDGGVRTRNVNIALPETNVFTRIIQVPALTERELATAIKWEAEQYIPLPLSEVYMDFSIIGETKDSSGTKKLDILLVASPKTVIDRYKKIMEMSDLEVAAMETEIIAISRAIIPPILDKPLTVMIINLGSQTTDFSIFRSGLITFTRSVPIGGSNFTKALAQDMGFPLPQAEEFKKTYGLQKDQLEGKVRRSLIPIFTMLIDEIKRAITFFQNKYTEEVISTIILSGSGAKLPGLVEAMVEAVGVETQIGNPWSQVVIDAKRFPELQEKGAVFTVAIGLAMRES